MKRLLLLVSLLAVASLAFGGAPREEASGSMGAQGGEVTIFTAAGEEQMAVFRENFVGFQERTGINVIVEGSGNFEELAVVRSEAGDPYDILNFPQPGLMADMGRSGYLVNIEEFIPRSMLEDAYASTWIDLGTVDGQIFGVWHGADVKSLVWYPKRAFEERGYQIPQTWDELIALSEQIVADGGVPWTIGIESGGATGWPATDWVEDVLLRTAPPEAYDAWTRGDLKFNSPEINRALDYIEQIWGNPDFVLGGTTGILTTAFGDAPLALFDDPPSAWLHRQASFIPNFFPEGTVVGEDVDYFYFPPIDPEFGRPVLGSGNLISLAKDTPAGREVVSFMITPESVEAEVRAGNVVAPMNGVPMDWYPSDTQRGYAEILMNADTFRFDGSDLMPGAVGAGSFWTGMVDIVSGADRGQVLDRIDASWPR